MDVGSNGRVQGPLILRTYSFVFLPGAHAPHLNMPPRLLERKEKKSHILVKRKEKKRTKIKNKKSWAGSTFPASSKEKETHWPNVP